MKNKLLYQIHANICQSLTHPTRLEIVDSLRDGEKSVSQLAKDLGIPQATVSRHLGVICSRGIVLPRGRRPSVFYRLGSPKIATAYDLMHQFSLEQFSSTAELLVG